MAILETRCLGAATARWTAAVLLSARAPNFVLITLMFRLSKSETQLPCYPKYTTVCCWR